MSFSSSLRTFRTQFHSRRHGRKHGPVRQCSVACSRPAVEDLESRILLAGSYGQLPLSFEPNVGQTSAQVQFQARGAGYGLFLAPGRAVLNLESPSADQSGNILGLQLVGANNAAPAVGQDRQASVSNYFIGNDPSAWHANVPHYGGVRYENVYPGINIVYYGNQGQLEYDFDVAPGGDPGLIRLGFTGTQAKSLDSAGNLVLHTSGGDVVQHAPVLYQETDGVRQEVAGQYVINQDGTVSFAIGAYDANRALMIDPLLVYSTYLGGNGGANGWSIAVDSSGAAYIAGDADVGFPTVNALQGPFGGGVTDAFVSKLNAAGSALVYSTYFGGGNADGARGIAVDSSGAAYVTGYTTSTNFPTANALQGTFGGTIEKQFFAFGDAFVAKLNPAGSALLYSTYLGGKGDEVGHGIAVDSSGDAYVTGETTSADFPTVHSLQSNTNMDAAFVAKLNPSGSALLYSTYLGGNQGGSSNAGNGIAVDSSGAAYVTGQTNATDFATTTSAFQRASGGDYDAFVTKLNPAGSALIYSTYLGGAQKDFGNGIAVDSSGVAHVTGATAMIPFSNSYNDFPTANALQGAFSTGVENAFVTALNAAGSALIYSTFLGGGPFDFGSGIAVDSSGDAYVVGNTDSSHFPTANAIQESYGGGDFDAFVTKLNPAGALFYSTYLGGTGRDDGRGIAVDSLGNAYVTGQTGSTDFPMINALQGHQSDPSRLGDTFITKIDSNRSLTATQKYIAAVYLDLLGRPVDAPGLNFWSGLLDHGTARSAVATSLTHSDEYFATIIRPAYQQFLSRDADAGGLSYWTALMHGGLTDEQLEAGFIGSPEFYNHSGGTDKGWVDAMYQNLLGRLPDGAGESYWINQLAQGANRGAVAYGFAASLEREIGHLTDDYRRFLGRFPGPGEINFWVIEFLRGVTNEDIITGFIASDEYANGQIVDHQPPVIIVQSPGARLVTNKNVTVTGHVTDDRSGVATLQAQVDAGTFTSVSFDAAGAFSFTTALALEGSADGRHRVRLQATDKAGNLPAFSDVFFTLAAKPPAAPAAPHLLPASDSGVSQTDDITNVTSPTVLVDVQAGQLVRLFVDGHQAGATTAASSQVSFVAGPLADGVHQMTATVQDAVGNVSSASAALAVTIDTVTPAAPVFDLTAATDSGAVGDHTTNFTTVALTGAAAAGVRIDVLQTGDTTSAAGGAFTLTNIALRLGDNSLTARATGVAGNQSSFTRVITRVAAATTTYDLALQAFEAVHNEISFTPYNGLQKGGTAAGESGAGNDWDQAALLIDRLTALGVVARFVSGRVSAPVSDLMAWLGVENSSAVDVVLKTSGANPVFSTIPDVLEFDHTWVEADVPLPHGGSTTVAVDPSWKFRQYHAGLTGILTKVPFDMNGFLSQVRTERGYEFYQDQVAAYLKANDPTLSLADVPHDGPIIAEYPNSFPAALPYTVLGALTRQTTAPDVIKQRATLTLSAGATTLFVDNVIVPDVALERITVSYADAGGGNVLPQLRIAGQIVQTGAAVAKGASLALKVESLEPGDGVVDQTWSSTLQAGDYAAVGLDVNQFSPTGLTRMQAAVNQASFSALAGQSLSPEDQIGAFLGLAISKWFYEYEVGRHTLNGLTGAVAAHQGLEFGVTTSRTTVGYFADLQNPFVPPAAAVDIPGSVEDSVPIDDDASGDNARFSLIGLSGSSQEHALWEELINTPSMSTVKSLQIAAATGIPVLVINSGNKAAQMSQLTLSASDVAAISAAVDAGATVTTPRDPTPLRQWSGVGYIADYGTSVAYMISGGLNAAQHAASHGGFASGDPIAALLARLGTPDQNQYFCPIPAIQNGVQSSPGALPNPVAAMPVTADDWAAFVNSIPAAVKAVTDPVNSANGNVVRDETDVQLIGIGLSLEFARHYDSQSTLDMGMGPGWVFSYGDFLAFNSDNSITWTTQQGYGYTFTPNGAGYSTPDTLHGTFTAVAGGFRYRYQDGLTYTFDTLGRVTEIRDRNDNALTLTHVGTTRQLSAVSEADAPSHTLTFTYTAGLLTSVADFTGRSWTYQYTAGRLGAVAGPGDAGAVPFTVHYDYYTDAARSGLLRQITVADGGALTYTYYPNRRAFQGVGPDGNTNTFSYNLYRQQTTHLDADGGVDVHGYDLAGDNLGTTFSDGTSVSTVWTNGLRTKVTDTFGNSTQFVYDSLGNVTRRIDFNGVVTDYTYDPVFSNIISVAEPGGRVTHFDYDNRGNLKKVTDAAGGQTTFTYDVHGLVQSSTRPNGNLTPTPQGFTTRFTYNDAGQAVERDTDAPSVEKFDYDARGNLKTHTDADGNATAYTYDIRDRLIKTTDALGHDSSRSYDVMGNVVSITDVLGRTTKYKYDAREHMVAVTQPDLTVDSFAYDQSNDLTASTDELGRVTHYQIDALNRRAQTIFADGTSNRTLFDSENRVQSFEDAAGNIQQFGYDKLGRMTQQTFLQGSGAPGPTLSWTYDDLGNLLRMTDALGHVTAYDYDLLDRNTKITDPDNGVTSFAYDADGNATSVTDADGNKTSYTYDLFDRKISETDALGAVTNFTLDAFGNLTAETDRDGRKRTFDYDALNRKTAEKWLDGAGTVIRAFSYNYDAAGQLKSASDAGSSLTYTYDARGRISTVTNVGTANTPVVTLAYSHDNAGNLIATTDSVNGVQDGLNAYTYDDLNRMIQVVQTGPGATDKRVDLTYNGVNQFATISRFADVGGSQQVAATSYAYDFMNRLTSMTDVHGATTLASESLTYDGASRITQVASDAGTTNLIFDNRDQLTAASYSAAPGRNESYTYDPAGNRLSSGGQSIQTDPGNRLKNDGVFKYAYDDEGNLIQRTEIATGKVRAFQWDYRNRLTAVIDRDASGTAVARTDYTYDAFDRRIAKAVDANLQDPVPAATTQFIYDQTNVLLEFTDADGSAGPQAPTLSMHYLYGPAIDQIMAQEGPAHGTVWALADHLGSVRTLVDGAGGVLDRLTYDSFGTVQSSGQAGPITSHLFAGREFDAETGLYYNRARYFDAAGARFLSQDPIRFGGGDVNLYRYVHNNPFSMTDPTGLDTFAIGGTITGFIGIVGVTFSPYLVWDGTSKIPDLQLTIGGGFGFGARISGAGTVTVTNADSTSDLTGKGIESGGGAGLGKYVGVDYVVPDPNAKNQYGGGSVSGGIGVGFDIHKFWTRTGSLSDVWKWAKSKCQ